MDNAMMLIYLHIIDTVALCMFVAYDVCRNPLPNAIILSDLSETFISNSWKFFENKMFLHDFFFLQGLPRYKIF